MSNKPTKIHIDIDAELIRRIKMRCVENRKTMREFVPKMIEIGMEQEQNKRDAEAVAGK